jgi:Tol biopolymer transport system component
VYSILNVSPQPITGVRTGVPVELERIVNKCLEKNASDRYQHTNELIVDLHHLTGTTPDIAVSWMLGKKKIRPFILPVVAVLGLILVLVGYFFNPFLLSHAPQLNPDMKISQLQIPFQDVWYANVSRDGRWLVFPATDVNGKYDVYMMNLSQGQPKKVTNDSSDGIFGVAISPDASTILYSRQRLGERDRVANELVSVPWLGGKPRVIIDSLTNANWRPDGERIGYHVISPTRSGRQINEFWTAKPDGSDRHREIADTLEVIPPRWSWDWSPDMKSLVWLRYYAGGYTELIIRNLETGKERQLTFDKKITDEGRWTQNGSIIFSSNRGGNQNLWMVPSSGGEPVQLTRGSGPDAPIWISADCRRMIYSEDQRIGQIKLGNLADGSVRQLTVDELRRLQPSISPTGALIAFVVANESGAGTDIYVMDRQGAEIRALTGGPEVKFHPSWSPDERWITYSAYRFTEPPDSSRVYLINVDNSSQPRLIGNGTAAYWFNEREFIVWGSTKSSRGSVDRPGLVEFAEDSVWICPILDGKYMVVRDNRVGREGAWITTARSYESSGLKEARQLVKGAALWPVFARDGRELLYAEPGGAHDLHRISLPDGKDEKVGRVFPGLRDFSVRRDGKEIVYTESHQKTRFQIIDNLFK